MIQRALDYFNSPFFQLFFAVGLALALGFWLGREVSFQPEGAFPDSLRPASMVERRRSLSPTDSTEPLHTQLRRPTPAVDPASAFLPGNMDSPITTAEDLEEETLLDRCQGDWALLASREVDLLEDDFLHMRPLFSEDCVQAMLEVVDHPRVIEFLTGCHIGRLELQDWQIGACLELVPRVRDFVILQSADLDPSLPDLNVTELEDRLYAGHRHISQMSLEELHRNFGLAEELLARNPRSYLGLKSQLLNLLLQEVKFAQPVSPNDYAELFDQLLMFDVVSPEAAILSEAYELDPADPSPWLSAQELMGMDRDLIHLPFVRLSALNDLESLMDVSLEYIDFYPDSYLGYFYLAESQWRMGDQAAAFQSLRMGMDLPDSDEMLLRLMSQFQRSPLERLYEMAGAE